MPQIRRELPGCTLRLVGGDFAPGGKAQQFAHGKGIDNGVEYAGERTREELPAELDAADLLVQPSREESFGNTLAEAMARRVPALGGEESGAVPWVLDYGRCGELCDVNDPSSIAAAAVKILRDEKQWRKFSQAGFARARATFGLDSVVEACLLEYELILNRRRAAA
jgi:glycosyltransferase involved in cell wall biosynthesis